MFPPSIIGSAVVGAAIGGVSGHLWKGMSRADVKEFGEAIDAGEAALVIVGETTIEAYVEKAELKAQKKVAKELAGRQEGRRQGGAGGREVDLLTDRGAAGTPASGPGPTRPGVPGSVPAISRARVSPKLMTVLHILSLVLGTLIVLAILGSALKTVVLPQEGFPRLSQAVFALVYRLLVHRWRTMARASALRGLYAPVALVSLPLVWMLMMVVAFTFVFWGTGSA